ncbi:antibiotic biosynthesis monooxygenase [Anaerolineae bacterium CFX9]|nr:antibiotic biosynthesis monooxygenase [Anaerolineae bacterium CFX9]
MYGLMGKISAQPGQREALIGHLIDGLRHLSALDGCYAYIISRAADDPDGIWVTEAWRSAEDHLASLSNEGVRAVITAARPLIAGMSDRVEFEPVAGKGLLYPQS